MNDYLSALINDGLDWGGQYDHPKMTQIYQDAGGVEPHIGPDKWSLQYDHSQINNLYNGKLEPTESSPEPVTSVVDDKLNLSDVRENPSDKEITEFECAELAMKYICFMVRHNQLHSYQYPVYNRLSEREAISMIKKFMPKEILRIKSHWFWRGVIKQIETTASIQNDENIPYKPEEIVFRNGVYNVLSGKMREASPDDFFLSCNDTDFNPKHNEDGGIVEEFFETFSDGDKEVQRLAWTVIGCILSPGNHFRKFFMLYGAPAAGKSLIGLMIEELVGKKNCSHIPLNKIGLQFYSARLYNKQLNTCLDLSYTELKDIGMLKLLTSGIGDQEETSAKYGRFVTLETDRIKMLFACNKLPRVSKEEYAKPYYDRMVLVPFLHTIPPEKRDPMLKEKLLAQKNYIIKKALKHYKKLLRATNSQSAQSQKLSLKKSLVQLTRLTLSWQYDAG